MRVSVFKSGGWILALGALLCMPFVALADSDSKGQAEYHVLAAELAGQRGEHQIAAEEYVKALMLAPSLELAERATQVAVFAGDMKLALEAASQWAEFAPEDLEPRIVLMRVAATVGQDAAALAQASYIANKHPQGPQQAFRDIAHALSTDTSNPKAAMAVMDGLADEFENDPELDYATGLLALRQAVYDEAVAGADRAIAAREGWAEAYLLKASALLRDGRAEEAMATVNSAALTDSRKISLHLAFSRLLLEQEMGQEAAGQYGEILKLDDEHPEALYAMGVIQINLGNPDLAYDHFYKLYDDLGVQKDLAAYYLGGIEETRGNHKEALNWYEKVQEGDRYLDAAQRKAYVLYKTGDLAEARRWLSSLRDTQPDMAVQFYLAEGELLHDAKRFDDAMALYNEGIENYPEALDLYYGRSLIAERLGRLTLAEKDLRHILKEEPGDARSLNALGYILANHTDRYEEALELISLALEQTPDDAAVIDSMGWVQYRLGNLDEAYEYLTKAFDAMPDPEVAAHLGEVLWEMGRQEQAEIILEQALQEDPSHPTLRDTIKRLIQ